MLLYDDHIPLDCLLELPAENKESFPLFILMHGFCGNKKEPLIEEMAHMLRAEGFATLRPDMYAHGESGGYFKELTVYKWISNAMCLVDYAAGQKQFSRIYLCGHSLGGLTALMAAAMEKDRIAGVIGLAPALSMPERARKGILMGTHFDPARVPESFMLWNRELGGNYVRIAQTIYPRQYLEDYTGPLLFVHGDADEIVPPDSSRTMVQYGKNAELSMIPGAGHDFEGRSQEAVAAARLWVKKQGAV